MKIIADLHLHSKYSRAVSQKMEPVIIAQWAVKKGIDLVGTGDWTHPVWLKELEASLEEIEEGVFQLRFSKELLRSTGQKFFSSNRARESLDFQSSHGRDDVNAKKENFCQSPRNSSPYFILSTEISSIYSQGGKLRRIHNLLIAPSFATVSKINEELKSRGCNLMSDGRPIVGLSSQQLCELVWSIDEDVLVIPAHIWTPWFSLYGSKSGFDSIKECFGEFSDRIYAIETGLSSDPGMNWRIKELENRSIVSFSDAHSPPKLGREATVFELEKLSFETISDALKQCSLRSSRRNVGTPRNKILYTIEFYPEEGKYHYTGHRNCGVKQTPEETFKKGSTCPVCGRPLTVGVMHRVEQLAKVELKITKKKNEAGLLGLYNAGKPSRPPYVMLVPLMEILAESLSTSVTSQKVIFEYKKLTENLDSEFDILMHVDLDKIAQFAGDKVAEAIKKVRSGNIVVDPGYDGVFGIVKIWSSTSSDQGPSADESAGLKDKKEQMALF